MKFAVFLTISSFLVAGAGAISCYNCQGNVTECERKQALVNCGDMPFCYIRIDQELDIVEQTCATAELCKFRPGEIVEVEVEETTTIDSATDSATDATTPAAVPTAASLGSRFRRRRDAEESTTAEATKATDATEMADGTTTSSMTEGTTVSVAGETVPTPAEGEISLLPAAGGETAPPTTTVAATTKTTKKITKVIMDCCQQDQCNCAGNQCFTELGGGAMNKPSVVILVAMQLLGAAIIVKQFL